MQPNRLTPAPFDVLHSRRICSFFLHDWSRPAAFRTSVVGCRIFNDCFLPALEQSGAGILHVADARSSSWRRARRALRASPLLLRTLSTIGSRVSLASCV